MKNILGPVLFIMAAASTASAQDNDSCRKLVEIEAEACCYVYEVHDAKGNKIGLPEEVADGLDCPMTVSLSPDGNRLVYLYNYYVKLYDFNTGEIVFLNEFSKVPDGFSDIHWLPDELGILYVEINQNKFEEMCRIVLIYLSDDQPVDVYEFKAPVNFMCGSICFSLYGEDFWMEGDEIYYNRHDLIEERPSQVDTIRVLR